MFFYRFFTVVSDSVDCTAVVRVVVVAVVLRLMRVTMNLAMLKNAIHQMTQMPERTGIDTVAARPLPRCQMKVK